MKIFRNFIAGSWVEPSTGEHFENVNPADTTDVIGRFPLSGAADVDKAIKYGFGLRFAVLGMLEEKVDREPVGR